MPNVGGASVRISPDLDTFRADLVSKMQVSMDGVGGSVPIGADLAAFDASMADLMGRLTALSAQTASPNVNLNGVVVTDAQLDDLTARLAAFGSADVAPYVSLGGFAETNARLEELTLAVERLGDQHPVITPQVNIAPALASIASVKAAQDAASATNSSKGIIGGLLWGGGSNFRIPWTGMGIAGAGFGSLASFAGFGPEHVALTGAGLLGSATAGLVGGGSLLGLGALGTSAVGMGTDSAGIGQAAGDIKNVYTAMQQLTAAEQQYGQGSTQAAAAQQNLNTVLGSFNPVAKQAVENAAGFLQAWTPAFDAVTGEAEKMGAEILLQAGNVAKKFLPIIGEYATQNTSIIQRSLQPLFDWVSNPKGGMLVFEQLEQTFQRQLPTAMGAFDQGMELLARTVQYASGFTGHFMKDLDNLFTRMNTTAGWDKWTAEMNKLIDGFHMWATFIDMVVKDLHLLFSEDAGTAQAIIGDLTTMLDHVHSYLESTSGAATVHDIFVVHRQEIIQLIDLVAKLVDVYARIYSVAAPPLVKLATIFIDLLLDTVKFLEALGSPGKVILFGAGITLITSKLVGLGHAWSLLQPIGLAFYNMLTGNATRSAFAVDEATETQIRSLQAEGAEYGKTAFYAQTAMQKMVASGEEADPMLQALYDSQVAGLKRIQTQLQMMGPSAEDAAAQVAVAEDGIVATTDASATAIDAAIGSTGVGLILIGLGIAITELMEHWRAVWNFVVQTIEWVAREIYKYTNQIVVALMFVPVVGPPLAALIEVFTHLGSVMHDTAQIAKFMWQDMKQAFDDGVNAVSSVEASLFNTIDRTMNSLVNGAVSGWGHFENAVLDAFNYLVVNVPMWWGDVENAVITGISSLVVSAPLWFGGFENAVITVLDGIIGDFHWAFGEVEHIVIDSVNHIVSYLDDLLKGGSFITKLLGIGGLGKVGQLTDVTPTTGGPAISFVTPTPGSAIGGVKAQPGSPFDQNIKVQGAGLNLPTNFQGLGLQGPGWANFTKMVDSLNWTKSTEGLNDLDKFLKMITDWMEGTGKKAKDQGPQYGPPYHPLSNAPAGGNSTGSGGSGAVSPLSTAAGQQQYVAILAALNQLAVDGIAASSQMKDAANVIKVDSLAAAASISQASTQLKVDIQTAQTTHMTDVTQTQSDQTSAIVQSIQDASAIQVDKMAEQGLTGLALRAQEAQVALDQLTAIQDAKLASGQAHVDQVKAHGDDLVAKAQAHLDAVSLKEDAKVNTAQLALDRAQQHADQQINNAQRHVDEVAIYDAIHYPNSSTTIAMQKATDQLNLIKAQQAALVLTAQDNLNTAKANQAVSTQNAQDNLSKQQANAASNNALAARQLEVTAGHASIMEAYASAHLAKLNELVSLADKSTAGGAGGVIIHVTDTHDPYQAAQAMAFHLKLAGVT